MLKRLCLAFAGLFAFVSLASGAGTVPGFSLTPQFDLYGKVAPGCKLYIIQAGTTSTPQNAYQDSALTLPQPNPMICDAGGRLSQFFVADGVIKLRLTTSAGSQIFVGDNLLVVGPSSGGGGGGTVDPTTILATGDFKQVYNTGVLTGFVRCNGRTIGSSTSGATERANADTQTLFQFLWGADSNLAVSGGRGASANADWVANKALTLPDCRGRGLTAMTDMGASASTIWDSANFTTGGGTTLGATAGVSTRPVLQSNLPNVNFALSGTISVTSTNSGIPLNAVSYGGVNGNGTLFGVIGPSSGASAISIGSVVSTGSFASGTAASGGSGTVLQTASPFIFVTTYIKL